MEKDDKRVRGIDRERHRESEGKEGGWGKESEGWRGKVKGLEGRKKQMKSF